MAMYANPATALKGTSAVAEALPDNPALQALAALATDAKFDRGELTITSPARSILAACEAVKAAGYTFFEDLTAVDWYPQEPRFQLSYHILSMGLKQRIRLVVQLDSAPRPSTPSPRRGPPPTSTSARSSTSSASTSPAIRASPAS
jgi:NADH-quinone oxidoreductase subunit C